MSAAMTAQNMSPQLQKVAERAKREPEGQFYSLAHLLDIEALRRAYGRLRKDAAVGVDGVSKDEYGQRLEENLRDLHERMRAKRYRHQPIRRVHIPKDNGKTRPIGVSAVEDKIVQGALTELLSAIYEQDFLNCSYGFRPGRSAHDALAALNKEVHAGRVSWIFEADIVSFFDNLDRTKLKEMLQIRVTDGSIQRLIGKCLHVGVLDGAELNTPDQGTAQGSALSPLLGNVYLHYVLDLWFEHEVKPRLKGHAVLIRYCDDFVIGFQRQDDAERVTAVLGKRLAKYGLTLHPDKTRLIPFGRPPKEQSSGKGPGTFDLLGFTLYWRRTRSGQWQMWCKTRRARLQRTIESITDWCRRHRHDSVQEQHAALTRRVQGHMNYFGVNGNGRSLRALVQRVQKIWFKWLRRRSQRTSLNWERFKVLLKCFPLPEPRICVEIWRRA